MKKGIVIRLIIVIIGVIVVLLGRGLFYYSGFYRAPVVEMPRYEHIVVPSVPSASFSDNYTVGKGIIMVDLAHDNNFSVEELNVLLLRLVSRGLTTRFLAMEDDLEKELLGEKEGEKKEAELPDAFIVVSPQKEFSKVEKETVGKFVDKGGKLLLISDPTRYGKMNSLSLEFGLIFEPDYLYNQRENEINYKNIFLSDFGENEVTKGLKKIALYTAGSISSANASIAFVDANTFSNVVETRGRLSPMALTKEAKVLAIYDLTFMTEPHNGVLDNNRLIANIADWLMSP